ncbi:hypothetical protein DDB_G0277561 [Dictyostelium discoideum AX4]|uniref:Uncharacterized protein n=1 Tax=Dictyostelium discoideum TaxID=44689 RepID=Q54ZI7_DICDI|nr:hypothetical protein DDB_G0277561 [Dictyostelium discoideum AX4]EAL68743.1 hypothetical protein DDB_G0277561 [Dictyostelium discoideum AX4]|eukprot:XP_642655.1 hypothetical protein DDB_G0277561 [Dictyostelium discoideum AX4]
MSSSSGEESINISIDELEDRVNKLEFLLLGCQSTSTDSLLRIPLPTFNQITSAQKQSQQNQIQSSGGRTRASSISTSQLQQQQQQEPITDSLEKFKTVLNKIKSENESINNFMLIYKSNETLFNKIVDNESLLNSVEKLAIILSAEDEIYSTARNLQKLGELEKFINSSSTQSIPKLNEALKPLENIHFEQEVIAIQLNKKLEEKVQSYNDIIQEISNRFAYWDSIITDLESKSKDL